MSIHLDYPKKQAKHQGECWDRFPVHVISFIVYIASVLIVCGTRAYKCACSSFITCKRGWRQLTIVLDDAGIGDLLFGVVIGAFRCETQEFRYDILDVKYFRYPRFRSKEYLKQASKVVFQLLDKLELKKDEQIQICRGYIFDEAVNLLKETYGDSKIDRIIVTGEPQRLTEIAYLDEIRNLGYEPVKERDEKKAKSFFHMMNWLKKNPEKLIYAKTGWPRLQRYNLFRSYCQKRSTDE